MNIELLKKVALEMFRTAKIPVEINGYENDAVQLAVKKLFDDGVASIYDAKQFSSNDSWLGDNKKIYLGNSKGIQKIIVSDYEFEKKYGESLYD